MNSGDLNYNECWFTASKSLVLKMRETNIPSICISNQEILFAPSYGCILIYIPDKDFASDILWARHLHVVCAFANLANKKETKKEKHDILLEENDNKNKKQF